MNGHQQRRLHSDGSDAVNKLPLSVLVAAVIALPRTNTKSVQSSSSGGGSDYGPSTSAPGELGNVPGAGKAGLSTALKGGGATGGTNYGPGAAAATTGAPGSAHV